MKLLFQDGEKEHPDQHPRHTGGVRFPDEATVISSGGVRFPDEPVVMSSTGVRFPDEPVVRGGGGVRFPDEPSVIKTGESHQVCV